MNETIDDVTYTPPPIYHSSTGYAGLTFCCAVYPHGKRIFGVTVAGVDGIAWLRLAANGALWLQTPNGAAIRAADPIPLDTWVGIRIRFDGEWWVSAAPEKERAP